MYHLQSPAFFTQKWFLSGVTFLYDSASKMQPQWMPAKKALVTERPGKHAQAKKWFWCGLSAPLDVWYVLFRPVPKLHLITVLVQLPYVLIFVQFVVTELLAYNPAVLTDF